MGTDLLSRARDALNGSGNDDEAVAELRAVVVDAVREAVAEADREREPPRRRFRRTRTLLLFGVGVVVGYRLARGPVEPAGTVVEVTDADSADEPDIGTADDRPAERSGSWGRRLVVAAGLAGLGYAAFRRRWNAGPTPAAPADPSASPAASGTDESADDPGASATGDRRDSPADDESSPSEGT